MFQSAGARSGSKKFRGPGTVECSGNPRKIQSLPECNKEVPKGFRRFLVRVPCVVMSISASYWVQLNFTTLNTFKPMT